MSQPQPRDGELNQDGQATGAGKVAADRRKPAFERFFAENAECEEKQSQYGPFDHEARQVQAHAAVMTVVLALFKAAAAGGVAEMGEGPQEAIQDMQEGLASGLPNLVHDLPPLSGGSA